MKRRIILYPDIVGDYEGAYDHIPEAEFDKEENAPGYHSQEWPNLGGYVVIDYDEIEAERDTLVRMVQYAAEQAFQAEVVDTEMWALEARNYGTTGIEMEQYRREWIEDWVEATREQIEGGE